MTHVDLLADIGGTNARIAFRKNGRLAPHMFLRRSADFATIEDLLTDVVREAHLTPTRAAVAVAGPVLDDTVILTNLPWRFSCTALGEALGVGDEIAVFNDLEAVAWSLPTLTTHDLDAFRAGAAVTHAARVVLAPGTGLGVAALVPVPSGQWTAVPSEGGHAIAALQGSDAHHAALTANGPLSWEDVLSGTGLLRLYQALGGGPATTPAAVTAEAKDGDARARAAVDWFADVLGACAGDMTLIFGARGGCYIAGGVVPALGPLFDVARFSRAFTDKGPFANYLAGVPVFLIREPYPAVRGMAAFLDTTARGA